MKLDMGEQIRERPVFEDAIKEQHQNTKEEARPPSETDMKSAVGRPQWNIPSGGEAGDLEGLMSQMSLQPEQDAPTPRVLALFRLVRLALVSADRREQQQLADAAAVRSRPELFVRHLGKLLDKAKEDNKSDGDASNRTTTEAAAGKVQTREEGRGDKPKRKDLIEGLKDENDLCPRSPMRPHNHRANNNFPYQNTSRNHHSGGFMSAVASSDAIGPTPHYQNHPLYQSLGIPESRPPLIAETSDVLPTVETTFNKTFSDHDSLTNLTECDLEILTSVTVDMFLHMVEERASQEPNIPYQASQDSFEKRSNEHEQFPASISEINSTPFDADSTNVDRRVPTTDSTNIIDELFPSSYAPVDPWCGGGGGGGYYHHDDSTSGCSSLSPNSFSPGANPESPDSGRVVPDNTAPSMSPPGRLFFDDRLPIASDYARKTGERFSCDRSPGSSGYSSAGIPSPSEYEHAREDFDTKVQNASNDYFYDLESDFDSECLLPEFESAIGLRADGSPPRNAGKRSDAVRSTFATLGNAPVTFAPGYAVNPPSYPGAVGVSQLRPAKQLVVSSPSVANLKRLEPKVEPLLRLETGRERILKLMVDKKKKAEAWVNISLKINELAEQDHDGDTQLMILCANAEGSSVQTYVLEYVYAMVEMLRGIPGALSAVNHQGHSAAYLAALHGDYPHRAIVVRYIAETLIALGGELVHTTESGDSMLHELCKQGDQRYDVLVELLSLKNQAGQPYFDVNQYNVNGLTPLHVAVQSHGVNNVTSLMTVQLLLAERADILLPEKTESRTALHLAILHSCAPRLLEALLRGSSQAAGRACNTLNLRRDSPLHCAASRNDVPVAQQTKAIQLLLQHGAMKSLNAAGKFPIALVAEERRQEIRRVYETRKGNQANMP